MLKFALRTVMGGLLAASCLPTGLAEAQQAVMDEFYGNGVHNFYDRDFFQAMNNLSVAIDGGSKDPRAYYYRGLAKMRTGDHYGAQADMQMGAQFESADIDGFYPVSKALERVQGSERRELERYRALARAQARDRQLRRDAVRYEQRRRNEAQVLRAVPVGPPPAPLGVAPATAIGGAAPAGAPATAPETTAPAAAPPATPPPPASDDPFGDAPAETPAADAPASDSPFDAPAETPPAETPPATTPPATPPPPAAEPPATPPATEPAAEEDPFAEAPAAGAAEAPAAEAPAAETPAAETPAAPAAEPAEADPFADDPN
jgi:hypothetical protein